MQQYSSQPDGPPKGGPADMLHSCELPGHWLAIQTVTTCNTELRHAAHSPLPSPTPDPSQMACKSFEIKHHSVMKQTLTPVAIVKDRKVRDLKNMREWKRKQGKRARLGLCMIIMVYGL